MTDNETLTITDNRTQQTYTVPIYRGTVRAMDLRQIKTGPDDFGLNDLRSGVHEYRLLPERDHLPGRRQGHLLMAAIRSNNSPSSAASWKSPTFY